MEVITWAQLGIHDKPVKLLHVLTLDKIQIKKVLLCSKVNS